MGVERSIMELRGTVITGVQDFSRRMKHYPEAFRQAVGLHTNLYPGTINVKIAGELTIKEHARLRGAAIGEPNEDFLFEPCLINGEPAFRVRPCDAQGNGGHGDHILEICASKYINDVKPGSEVSLVFQRES